MIGGAQFMNLATTALFTWDLNFLMEGSLKLKVLH
jgi:hypothetical protein